MRSRPAGLAVAMLVLLLAFPAGAAAKRRCSSPVVREAPRVSHLVASRLKCTSARKVIAAVRRSDDWRGAFYGDRLGYVSYASAGTRRQLRCDYHLHGVRRPYVSVICRDAKNRRATVSAQLRRR